MTKSRDDSWVQDANAALADAGFRRGGSRTQVLDLLAGETCVMTAQEIDRRLPGVGRATVYRALEQLENLGLVQRVELAGDSAGYERVEPDGHHHHHMLCENCDRVVPFEDAGLERAIRNLEKRTKFRVTGHEVTLRGLCSRCGSASR